ncbi:hypothetical protein K458DRAFT_388821 [Lentithecium fluviatile CBS 122367]|uniref:Ribosomal protein S21 n=1 Tax=Lentithecium fluviatile CBS 122367 TaxID=1168545 RepID=A0A6G1J2B0_9PLEO|nr:hypothetical protein K458DRAFT_388821 [Lentithecium fluviatile CBS 122367]
MGSRSIGELLLRPTALSRLPFSQTSPSARLIVSSWSSTRALTNSTPSHAAQPPPRSREESSNEHPPQAPTKEVANPFADFLPTPGTPQRSKPRSSSDDVSQGIDSIFSTMNNSRFTRIAPAAPRASAATSSDELDAARTSHLFGADWSRPGAGGMHRRKPLDLNTMDGLSDLFNEPVPPVPEIPESEKNYPRLNPSYGRQINLDLSRGRDLVRGINMLGSLTARNKVKADFMKQRFHERPGLKRKRLKSERWRARFKIGFQNVTSRVTELTRKGW